MRLASRLIVLLILFNAWLFASRIPYDKFTDKYVSIADFMLLFEGEQYKKTLFSSLGYFYVENRHLDIIGAFHKRALIWKSAFKSRVAPLLPKSGSILDIGSGVGMITRIFSQYNETVGHFDIRSYEPDLKKFRELNLNLINNFTLNVDTYRYFFSDTTGKVDDYKG